MGLTTVQQQPSSDVVTHHSCSIQQSCDSAPMVAKECAGCGKRIVERYLLKALDIFWHEDCLKCGCCDCRLGEVGSTLYIKANLILCKRDYLRLFGNTGSCSACNKIIPAYEMVMRAKYNVYHLECFACFACQHRLVLETFCISMQLHGYWRCSERVAMNNFISRRGLWILAQLWFELFLFCQNVKVFFCQIVEAFSIFWKKWTFFL